MTGQEPEPYSAFLERALYAPGRGFYEAGGRAGRRQGDFVTSPEVGPLFGACVARALDRWWDDLGRPDPFLVDEHGAGPGTLARTVVVAGPACGEALRWTLVERAAAQRAGHPDHLPHVGDLGPDGAAGDPTWAGSGHGPLVASTATGPDRPAHVVLANELLDNLPFDLLERGADGWREVRVAGGAGDPAEALVAADPDDVAWAEAAAPDAGEGARVPVQRRAARWVTGALGGLVAGGRLVVVDYATTTAALAARPPEEWIRTYAGHARGGGPLEAPGTQDVTVEVCTDQLAAASRAPDRDRDQASALREWGLDELVEVGRRRWAEAAGAPDLAALRARSRVAEAQVLTDPGGLGAFRVLEWSAGP